MAITAAFENNATVGTAEYSMPAATTSGVPTSQTDDGIYQAFIDAAAMVAGDQFEVKVYEKVTSGGTQRVLLSTILTGAQAGPVVMPSLVLLHGWDMTLKKLAGTDRAIYWSIRKIA
jgi:hypothetical protein